MFGAGSGTMKFVTINATEKSVDGTLRVPEIAM
ncbi:predicted protein [Sclerotinia sclerotiorum 1980 UF-70]|uniref:Uncharacterized protein n=1 Tax=Sclerotinia sclerotiorum (strain ATCC 18683 / 1980 / Ss-1) TaxID=665079 RepID=A7EE81_SCLS1|nr:predicted protein [Sclerotinia sclerotiorum 1980 UF-70]EDO01147.1 predicted protein [Sclerotinia sclerotiorum 1980 UF-70]